MVRRSLIPALVILLLLPAASHAQEAAYEITFEPEVPVTGDQVTFHAKRVNPGNGGQNDLFTWDFGDGGMGTGPNPAPYVYKAAGTYTVILVVTGSGTSMETVTLDITVGPNAPPSAAFSVFPASPVAGEPVSFAGGSDPDGDFVRRLWDFGDGATDTEPTPSHTYANAGDYTATLTATDEHEASATTFQTVTVRAPTEAPPAGGPPASAPPLGDAAPITGPDAGSNPLKDPFTPPVRMRPFPVVRIAGVVLPRGARVQILSVRAPRGSRIQVRCLGRGCPVGSMATTSATRLVRLRKFERRLAAGTRLRLFVRQENRIGKYTSFLIRAGEAPKRVDLCLFPTRRSPGRCP